MSGYFPAATETSPANLCRAIRDLFMGRSNATGTFTMTVDVGSTTVAAQNVGAESKIVLVPLTANAATEFGAGTWYISNVKPGSFTVVHVNSATETRTFAYVIAG